MSQMTISWAVLLGLGAFHGINPGMGWLFAVALGMQERRRGAVFSALLPLALGHVLAVGGRLPLRLLSVPSFHSTGCAGWSPGYWWLSA